MVDAGDSKSPAARRAGSIPAPGTSSSRLLIKILFSSTFCLKIYGYLMNDDEFSGFISSGKKMRVSVSEHTGNAKNPKNIVTSDEQDTLGKVLAFEGKEGEFDPLAHNLAEEKNLRLDKYDTKTTQDVNTQKAPANTATVENLQKFKQDSVANDNQAAPRESETTANKQSVQTTAAKANLQSVSADT